MAAILLNGFAWLLQLCPGIMVLLFIESLRSQKLVLSYIGCRSIESLLSVVNVMLQCLLTTFRSRNVGFVLNRFTEPILKTVSARKSFCK